MMSEHYDRREAAFDALADAVVSRDPSGAIERQEARAQADFVSGDSIPAECLGCTVDDLRALGLAVGEPYPGDPLFRLATLPAGWSKVPSSHPMWSYLIDGRGFRRCAMFFKGAFYDRKAHISILDPPEHHLAYLAADALYEMVREHPNDDLTWPDGLDAATEQHLDAWLDDRVARIRRRDAEDDAAGRGQVRYIEEPAYLRLHAARRG